MPPHIYNSHHVYTIFAYPSWYYTSPSFHVSWYIASTSGWHHGTKKFLNFPNFTYFRKFPKRSKLPIHKYILLTTIEYIHIVKNDQFHPCVYQFSIGTQNSTPFLSNFLHNLLAKKKIGAFPNPPQFHHMHSTMHNIDQFHPNNFQFNLCKNSFLVCVSDWHSWTKFLKFCMNLTTEIRAISSSFFLFHHGFTVTWNLFIYKPKFSQFKDWKILFLTLGFKSFKFSMKFSQFHKNTFF